MADTKRLAKETQEYWDPET